MFRFFVSAAFAALLGSVVPAAAQTSIAQLDRLRLEWADLDANDPWTPRGAQHWGKSPWPEDWIHFTPGCSGHDLGCEGESLLNGGGMVRTDEREDYVLRREGRFNPDGTVDMRLRTDGNSRAPFDLALERTNANHSPSQLEVAPRSSVTVTGDSFFDLAQGVSAVIRMVFTVDYKMDPDPNAPGWDETLAVFDGSRSAVFLFAPEEKPSVTFTNYTTDTHWLTLGVGINMYGSHRPPIPEPGSYVLMLAGLAVLAAVSTEKRRRLKQTPHVPPGLM
ncbi:PEP-CTERM sorting domain-containing protein [Schlegelella sp. S2-27]|uniref:PEP-CTERM sorting domain-containing protein n=1 Tax=Caldimonas mangrovi TaxID=2944811 RepID=A0ABT0YQE6_9BURK|nr:PEP-CTERM sorting domain-containing protein [Caldimonas mangrovi]MCM5680963.1 PEP-CTERM sorting domain-containing protein [Caldimonas mangrovi]